MKYKDKKIKVLKDQLKRQKEMIKKLLAIIREYEELYASDKQHRGFEHGNR